MKRIFFTIMIVCASINSYANSFVNWLEHCNFSLGLNAPIGMDVEVGKTSERLYIWDDYKHIYTFKYDAKDAKDTLLPITTEARFPFFFTEHHTVGASISCNSLYNTIAQGHADLYYSYDINRYLQLSIFGGWSCAGVDMDLGKLKKAYPYNHGYLVRKGKYVNPDTHVKLSGFSPKGFNLGTSIKVRPLPYDKIFVQLGYRYTGAITISEYDLKLDSKKISSRLSMFDDIKISSIHHIALSCGWGY